MSQRDQVQMSDAEIKTFLRERHTMQIATNGQRGFPHLVPMWYGFLDDAPALWTYDKSQKVQNLRRDDRLTALVETGQHYSDLQGVMLLARGMIIDDQDVIVQVGESIQTRYIGPLTEARRKRIIRQSRKRVAVRLDVEQIISWNHQKIA